MKLTEIFHKKTIPAMTFDHDRLEPVIRCSICTGEQVAGFLDKNGGRFEDVMLIRSPGDLAVFMERYGIKETPRKIY